MKGVVCLVVWMMLAAGAAFAEEINVTLSPPEGGSGFTMEVLAVQKPRRIFRVYIYHTHTYEAYDMADGNTYTATETWRTADSRYNMIRVGEELKKELEALGVEVTHDVTAYEPPKLSTAYARSLEGLKKAAAEGYDLYIDLHRDAYLRGNGPNTVQMNGKNVARVLFLIGRGDSFDGAEKPDEQKNREAALWISDAMNAALPGISRGVSLKSGRYNQHAATPCILLEAGNNQNTLSQTLAAMPCVAQGICSYFDNMQLQEP